MTHLATLPARSHAPAIRPRTADRPRRAPLVAVALGGLGALAAAALSDPQDRSGGALDRRVQRALRWRWWQRVPHTARLIGGRDARRFEFNEALGGLGGRWPTLIGGGLAAVAVGWRYDARQALSVVAAVPLALGAHLVAKGAIGRRRPATARLTGKTTPSFPSGHAARAAALTGIVSHVAIREGVASRAVVLPLAVVVSIAGGVSRIPIDRHWATDLVGGWGLGVAMAAGCALWYDAILPDAGPTATSGRGARPRLNAPRIRHRSGTARPAPGGANGVYPAGRDGGDIGRRTARTDDEGVLR
jgi:membrane-associated phospholipid phosphatase